MVAVVALRLKSKFPWLTLRMMYVRFGAINVLVNNASKQYMNKDFAQTDLDNLEDIFRSNIIQMMAITKFALPHMSKGDS